MYKGPLVLHVKLEISYVDPVYYLLSPASGNPLMQGSISIIK